MGSLSKQVGLICIMGFLGLAIKPVLGADRPKPNIVNIVNFIRLLEPRDPAITQEVLYETVVNQVKLMDTYKLKGTFLIQYDALMDGKIGRASGRESVCKND